MLYYKYSNRPLGVYSLLKSVMVFVESVTNILNLINAIEKSGSEKHFKPIFDIWEGYKVVVFQPYPGGLFEGGVI